jgi:transcription elongation factor Elf1
MTPQDATPAVFSFARFFSRPLCPECGHEQFVPEQSSFVEDGGIRHAWLCEACGNAFNTNIEFGKLAI